MIDRLVRAHLRENAQQAVLNSLGIMFVVAMLLTIAATASPPGDHPGAFVTAVRRVIASLAWLITATAILVSGVNRVSQVKDRTREFAILRVFGCSFGFIADLLLQETICVALPGTIAGIVFAQINDSLIALSSHGLLTVRTPYMLWLPAGMIAAAIFWLLSLLSARSGMKLDVLEALGREG